ncbi:type IV secretion system protein [Nonomuraea sp. NPDC046570]|uniref:type IV secretion system protein n=1 Tax=Nonomuraea sp. NPDC046570 TaxID=3155255 RepID=UPI0033DB5B85
MKGPRNGRRSKVRLARRLAAALAMFIGILALPLVLPPSASAAAPICNLSGELAPQIVGTGMSGMLQPQGEPEGSPPAAQQQPITNYGRYGMAGQFWHTNELGCSDFAAVLGNTWANMIFDWAKAVDQLTITTYQAATTEGPLQAIKDVTDDIVGNLASAMYWPYLRPLVILGAIWLAWYGLIRKRATTTAEGVIWMVLAVTVAVWFFSRPGDFTGLGKVVTDKTGEVVNSAFSGLPGAGGTSCLPTKGTPGEAKPGGYGQPGVSGIAQNSDALWSTLVCKPWLMGQFGTADPNAPVVRDYASKLIDLQAVDRAEMAAGAQNLAGAQAGYTEMANTLKGTPIYPVFQGRDWSNRLGVAFLALMAAMIAGLLIFLVAVTLLVLKIAFLLLLILGPVFLLIGVHPGSGRIIAMRWVEMLVGTLLRQAVLALVLGLLVYGYALIISTAMPWGTQILFMALLTIAVFFYRRPFQHLFSSMNGHTLTTRMLGEAASSPMLERAGGALPPIASYRVGRWSMRKAEPLIQAAAVGASMGAAAGAGAAVAQGRARGEEGATGTASGTRVPVQAAPLNTDTQGGKAGARPAPAQRTGAAPPLNLSGSGPRASGGSPAGGSAPAGTSGGSGGGARTSGWFGGRSGGGWASRGGSSGPRSGASGGGTRSRGSGGGGSPGGGLFGGSSGSRNGSSGSRGGSGSSRSSGSSGSGSGSRGASAPRHADVPQARSAEPPPLWLPGRNGDGRGGDEPQVPFWLRPNSSDKD